MANFRVGLLKIGRSLRAFPSSIMRFHLRLFLALGVSVFVFVVWSADSERVRFLVAFDAAALFWLALVARLVLTTTADEVRLRVQGDDEGAWVALLVSALATGASLVAVLMESATASEVSSHRWEHVALAVGTLILSWLFFHGAHALHYAHEYYDAARADAVPMLGFPGPAEPDYWDFLYFSFTLGTSAQTADVTVNSSRLRRFVLGHQVLSYGFNATVIALGVNGVAALM